MRWREAKKGGLKAPIAKRSTDRIAPFSKRAKAFIVDSFMLLMPILYVVFYLVFGSREGFAQHWALGWLLVLAPYGFVTTLFFYKTAQTPGFKAYDIELKDPQTLRTPSLAMLLIRYLTALLTCITLIGLLLPLLRKDRRTLYDLLSRSVPLCK